MIDSSDRQFSLSLGVTGNGNLNIFRRWRIRCIIRRSLMAHPHHPLRMVVAVQSSFEQQAALYIARLRALYSLLSLTVMLFPTCYDEQTAALADQVLIGEEVAEKHSFLSDMCDRVVRFGNLCLAHRQTPLKAQAKMDNE